MVTGIMVVVPVGSLASRCMSSVRTSHAIFQSFGGFLVVCGLYFGMVVSLLYNRISPACEGAKAIRADWINSPTTSSVLIKCLASLL
jgi:hypothetical protein